MKKYNNYDFQKFSEKFSKLKAIDLLKVMIKKIFLKKIVVTSSFGAESVVILHLVSKIDRNIPNIILIVTLAKHTMIPVHLDADKDNPIS